MNEEYQKLRREVSIKMVKKHWTIEYQQQKDIFQRVTLYCPSLIKDLILHVMTFLESLLPSFIYATNPGWGVNSTKGIGDSHLTWYVAIHKPEPLKIST